MNVRDAIKAQFMKEYAQKEFSAITVKGLCAATPVARTTFYAHFSNTDDVRQEVENDLIHGLIAVAENVAGGNFQQMDFSRFMDEIERYIKEHWSDVYAFLVGQPNFRFMRKWKDAIKVNFSRRYPDKQQNRIFDEVSEILASSMLSAYTYWMEHPDAASTADIKPIIQKLLDSLVTFL
jgi:AcrR family transcriptional regulator